MTPAVIYILNDEHYYLARHTPSQEFLVWGTENLKDTSDSTIAYQAVNYLVDFTWNRSTDLHLLNELVEWSIFSAFQDEG